MHGSILFRWQAQKPKEFADRWFINQSNQQTFLVLSVGTFPPKEETDFRIWLGESAYLRKREILVTHITDFFLKISQCLEYFFSGCNHIFLQLALLQDSNIIIQIFHKHLFICITHFFLFWTEYCYNPEAHGRKAEWSILLTGF